MLLLKRFKIKGHSMEPLFRNGDTIIGSSIPYLFKKPKINDIVIFRKGEGNIFIKVVKKINKNNYYVEGLNKNDSFDSKNFGAISRNQIIGKVIYIQNDI